MDIKKTYTTDYRHSYWIYLSASADYIGFWIGGFLDSAGVCPILVCEVVGRGQHGRGMDVSLYSRACDRRSNANIPGRDSRIFMENLGGD